MRIIHQRFEILSATPNLEETIELAGRTCYKSEDKAAPGTAAPFVAKIRSLNHESVLEHGAITVKFITDRGVTHELVRHRIASFSQESTRYCNYSKGKFGEEITVVWPEGLSERNADAAFGVQEAWYVGCEAAEKAYLMMSKLGAKAQDARAVLPNSLKAEIVVTANPREWRHIFKLRCGEAAHPQMRALMLPCRAEFASRWPALFADLVE